MIKNTTLLIKFVFKKHLKIIKTKLETYFCCTKYYKIIFKKYFQKRFPTKTFNVPSFASQLKTFNVPSFPSLSVIVMVNNMRMTVFMIFPIFS